MNTVPLAPTCVRSCRLTLPHPLDMEMLSACSFTLHECSTNVGWPRSVDTVARMFSPMDATGATGAAGAAADAAWTGEDAVSFVTEDERSPAAELTLLGDFAAEGLVELLGLLEGEGRGDCVASSLPAARCLRSARSFSRSKRRFSACSASLCIHTHKRIIIVMRSHHRNAAICT